ncbi:MAG: polyphosphate polymerase domain-containing protein [Spirosomataceae bacterium]
MNTEFFLSEVEAEAWKFEKISLQEMEGVKLMDRVDVKYLIPLHLLSAVLADAQKHYKLLEINNQRLCAYETLYYDTEDLSLYHNHQAGRTNRYKVRFRNYVGSNLSFFEIKHKNNKGRTIKKRIKQPYEADLILNEEESHFLHEITPLSSNQLKGNLWVNYSRMTLVNKTSAERLTIDVNLTFHSNLETKGYHQMAIAEVKQERIGASPIIDIFKKYNIRSGSISKYCLGVISLYENVKYNRFKSKLIHLHKILNQYDSFARNSQLRSRQPSFSMV